MLLFFSKFKFKVADSDISALDCSVFLNSANGTTAVEAIIEYRWLDKAETKLQSNTMQKRYENMNVLKNGSIDIEHICKSKIVDAYMGLQLIDKVHAVNEIRKRTQFLDQIRNDYKDNWTEELWRYNEIT